MVADWIIPEWPAPANVRALMTTREGGVSAAPFDSFNLGDHVGDDPARVASNRDALVACTGAQPLWLKQVHGSAVAEVERSISGVEADASVSRSAGAACAVMTADCLPVLLCDDAGTVVAAAHAGWRGLCDGVIEATVSAMAVSPGRIVAWLGAAIGPSAFEVGGEVRDAFLAMDSGCAKAFLPSSNRAKWMADLYAIARRRLMASGVQSIHGGQHCTYLDAKRFYSYRRDGVTGRMVAMVWLAGDNRG